MTAHGHCLEKEDRMNGHRLKQVGTVLRGAAWCCCAAVLTGCSGSPAAPTPAAFENVAGTWTGKVGGVTQGVTLDGTITLSLQQSDGNLTGGYSVQGSLSNPVQTSPLQGSVTLTGTVASGSNPLVTFTTTSVPCPNLTGESWSGSFNNRTGVLTITGTGHVINGPPACAIALSYPQTIALTR
jgi:hypothetical protein